MIHLKNFSLYTPDDSMNVSPFQKEKILWLKSEEDNDWYQCQRNFKPDTIKIIYDKDGVIRAFGVDVSAMFPVDMSVVEIESNSIPDIETLTSGSWMYSNGIKPVTLTDAEIILRAENKKAALMLDANKLITPLQDAVELNIASDKEKSLLLELKKYRVLLNRVDTSKPVWPEIPDVA